MISPSLVSKNHKIMNKRAQPVFGNPVPKLDVRLRVFGQEYYVYSAILSMHSAYFRKFLDSPDQPSTRPDVALSSLFQYKYVTVVGDGDWSLEVVGKGSNISSKILEYWKFSCSPSSIAPFHAHNL